MNNETNETKVASRRGFALGAGLAGLALTGLKANAQTTTPPATVTADIAILNYALTLEHLEATFYVQGLNRFTATDFANASFASVLGPGTVNGVYANLGRIRDHEVTHVDTLRTTITSLGGTPVGPCTYRFPYDSPETFLQVALLLEETGVTAYDGAIAMISAAALKAAGASIATVEARHAAYLQLITNSLPFPKAFDETRTMQQILAAVAPFLATCPTSPTTPGTTTAVLLPKNLQTASPQVTLDASQSTSGSGALSYSTRATGRQAGILSANTASPQIQFNQGFGTYTFELTVTDAAGSTATDTTTVTYLGR
ncbi:MAG: ferritin-like domain-containing protein [Bryobacteraceae bacterium]|nr:ferritin-like domain-containing protein [Bryobacteraceae bacterium]